MPDGIDAPFDWKQPDYEPIIRHRIELLKRLRAKTPEQVKLVKAYYRENIPDFISDWGWTTDPRNLERGLPARIPFILFPKQREWITWIIDHWRRQKPGLSEKSRDMGLSWLAVSTSCSLCLFYEGMQIGFGSRLEEYVDQSGVPKTLFYKARQFMANLPTEFKGNWREERDAPYMRIKFPDTNSTITGEGGDNIGRGDRAAIYFVDEAAHLRRSDLVEASLSQTTNCRQDVSSANGMANAFAQKRFSGKIDVFTFHWRDDPRKDDAWYAKQQLDLDPVTIAQEIDIDYMASVEGMLIPSAWVQASIDAHIKIGFQPAGEKVAGFDVADEGRDKCSVAIAHGVVLTHLEEWSGKGSDIFSSVERAYGVCDENFCTTLRYDGDGLGAGVRGDAGQIEKRRSATAPRIKLEAFRGSAAIRDGAKEDIPGRKNEDTFRNLKAQEYWALRRRFQKTYRMVVENISSPHHELISIPSGLPNRAKLVMELAQPTYTYQSGMYVVDKQPDNTLSPNLADSVMIAFAQPRRSLVIDPEALAGLQSGIQRDAMARAMAGLGQRR